MLASALTGLGHNKEAFVEWQAALRINPELQDGIDGIAKILLAAGDNETVIAQLSRMQLDENLTLDLATAYGRTGLFNDAASTSERRAEDLPEFSRRSPLRSSPFTLSCRALKRPTRSQSNWPTAIPSDIEAQRIYLQYAGL